MTPPAPSPLRAWVSRIRDQLSTTYRQFGVRKPLLFNILHVSKMESILYLVHRKIFHPKELHVKYCFHGTYAKRFSGPPEFPATVEPREGPSGRGGGGTTGEGPLKFSKTTCRSDAPGRARGLRPQSQ